MCKEKNFGMSKILKVPREIDSVTNLREDRCEDELGNILKNSMKEYAFYFTSSKSQRGF